MSTSRPTFRIERAIGEGDATAAALGAFLAEHRGRAVDVIVNSAGGSAFEGAALLAELEAHGRVRARVRGIAASSASLLLCGAREILIHRAAIWMAHSPWGITVGSAEVHRETADVLDLVERSDVAAYSRASGHPPERIAAWLREELWLSAEEAIALNFADGFDDAEPEEPAPHDYTAHPDAPQALQRLAIERNWASAPAATEAQA